MVYQAYVYQASGNVFKHLNGGTDFATTVPVPTITGISPTSGPVGTAVSVTGTGLSGATLVKFGATTTTFTPSTATQISTTVPAGASTGAVTVTTPGGVATSSSFTVTTVAPPPVSGFQLVLDEQFVDNSAGRWTVYNNSTYGAPSRIQLYMSANTIFGTGASSGATGGTSLRQVVRRDNPNATHTFSAGMVDSKTGGFFYPLYGKIEFRVKIPHGHGIWPSSWLTARNGGSPMCEWDPIEYFHGQLPGKNSSTLHGSASSTQTNISGRYTNNQNRTFFEAPTYTPGWHIWTSEILPVTSSAGTTVGDVTQPSQNIRFRVLLDGVEVYKFVDTSALYWSTNGSTDINAFWNFYIQGTQIDGEYVGHPDVELAYSENHHNSAGAVSPICLISGTPGSCIKSTGGYNVIRAGAAGSTATMGGVAVTYEHDYIKVYKAV